MANKLARLHIRPMVANISEQFGRVAAFPGVMPVCWRRGLLAVLVTRSLKGHLPNTSRLALTAATAVVAIIAASAVRRIGRRREARLQNSRRATTKFKSIVDHPRWYQNGRRGDYFLDRHSVALVHL
jgi:hypothetical protein